MVNILSSNINSNSNNKILSGINIPIPGKTIKRQNGLRNLLSINPPKRTKKSGVMFSNGSKPGNNINQSLPKSTLSATSDKTFGTSVVPPTSVENAYSRNNYNRKRNETKPKSSWSLWGGKRRKTRRSRK